MVARRADNLFHERGAQHQPRPRRMDRPHRRRSSGSLSPDRLHPTSITPDGKRLLTHWDVTLVTPKIEIRVLELRPKPQLDDTDCGSGQPVRWSTVA